MVHFSSLCTLFSSSLPPELKALFFSLSRAFRSGVTQGLLLAKHRMRWEGTVLSTTENIEKFGTFFISLLHFLVQFLSFKQMKCQNKSVQASYFLQGWCPMFTEMVLQVCLLWWETLHHLLVSLCRTTAAAWGCPAVNVVVGLTQWQVSAVPVTAALCSSNHQEAKISDAAQKEAEKKAVGQNKRIHTQQDSHTCNHSG